MCLPVEGELHNYLRWKCSCSDEATSAHTNGTRGHPIHKATSRESISGEAGGQATGFLHTFSYKIHSTAGTVFRATTVQKTKNKNKSLPQKSCFMATNTALRSPSSSVAKSPFSAEKWNNPSFSPASVGWLGVTRHLAAAVHWLSLLGDCHLTVSIVTHTTGSEMYSKALVLEAARPRFI